MNPSKKKISAIFYFTLTEYKKTKDDCFKLLGTNIGVEKNLLEAVKWFTLAAKQGFGTAQNVLGFYYQNGLGVEQSHAEAVKWYTLAANQDFLPAKEILKAMLLDNSTVQVDKKRENPNGEDSDQDFKRRRT